MPHVASREAVIQMVELRRALEAEVAALAAERRDKADLTRIREAINALHAAVAAGGNGADEDVRFHTRHRRGRAQPVPDRHAAVPAAVPARRHARHARQRSAPRRLRARWRRSTR
jgi:DNA-binding GntR family transcriptional regulator